MKKRFVRAAIAAVFVILLLFLADKKECEALASDPFETPTKIRATVYTEHGTTASGAVTKYGTIAGKKDWLGCVAFLYKVNDDGSMGECIGLFEFKDTGAGFDTDGDGKGDSIKNGQSIDVWLEDDIETNLWLRDVGDYVYIFIVRGKG